VDKQEEQPGRQDATVVCPYAIRLDGRPDVCDIRDKMCMLESGLPCSVYDDYLEYVKEEEDESKRY
jgi:hypothetical protein